MSAKLSEILHKGRAYWDNEYVRPAVRDNFNKVTLCKTAALGAEVYSSGDEEKTVYHTCKSRTCPTCGRRSTQLWQRAQWARLPDVPYAFVVLTMPDVLWHIFQQNRKLLHDLPVLAAAVVQQFVRNKYGARVLVLAVTHTFAGRLRFKPHINLLVSEGGLDLSGTRWIAPIALEKDAIMSTWRNAVITYLRSAAQYGLLKFSGTMDELMASLEKQSERRWIIYVGRGSSKRSFLAYAGRYLRRPPVAQSRLTISSDDRVEYVDKNTRRKKWETISFSTREFVGRLAEHVPDRYQHSVRYFGPLAPRASAELASVFFLLGQQQRPPVRRLNWAASIEKSFGIDPLIDSRGARMRWVRRMDPTIA
jgi:hypothetical protein